MSGSIALATVATGWAAGGLLLGATYFAVLRRTADLFAAGGSRSLPVALTLGRFAGATLFFAAAVRFGALPLLGAFLGFLISRGLALRGSRRAA